MKTSKTNPSSKPLIIVNSATILVSLYKIAIFMLYFATDFFVWWIPQGKVFSYIHFWHFATFFVIPLPFGFYFIALILYLVAPIILISKIRKEAHNPKYTIFSLILLLGVLGSFVTLIGE